MPDGKVSILGDGQGSPQPPIDVVCLLGQGVLLNLRNGDLAIGTVDEKDGSLSKGWMAIDTAPPLAATLAYLHIRPDLS